MAYTTINDPTIYFNTKLYTANATSSTAITGVGFQPDWLWIKNRTNAYNHESFDSVRGATKRILPNDTDAETTVSGVTSFDSDGFTLGDAYNANKDSGNSIVAWCWKAGGSASSNSDGSITSSVSANTTAGFSIVSYTGTGSNATIGHGLGSVPAWIITKNRDATQPWRIYHKLVDASAPEDYGMILNDSSVRDNDNTAWNDTAPTSSVFSVGSSANTNNSSDDFIAYCFNEKIGFSKFGTYTGNGNTYGPYIHTGFKPAWVMGKRTDTTNNWYIFDSTRNTFNVTDKKLRADTNSAENVDSSKTIDILSNGVKIRSSDPEFNASGGTYIFMAFAESPFVNGNGIPTNAR